MLLCVIVPSLTIVAIFQRKSLLPMTSAHSDWNVRRVIEEELCGTGDRTETLFCKPINSFGHWMVPLKVLVTETSIKMEHRMSSCHLRSISHMLPMVVEAFNRHYTCAMDTIVLEIQCEFIGKWWQHAKAAASLFDRRKYCKCIVWVTLHINIHTWT